MKVLKQKLKVFKLIMNGITFKQTQKRQTSKEFEESGHTITKVVSTPQKSPIKQFIKVGVKKKRGEL